MNDDIYDALRRMSQWIWFDESGVTRNRIAKQAADEILQLRNRLRQMESQSTSAIEKDCRHVPPSFTRIDIGSAYIKGREFVLLGNPGDTETHSCDTMGCGLFDHVLIRCDIPEFQAEQFFVPRRFTKKDVVD